MSTISDLLDILSAIYVDYQEGWFSILNCRRLQERQKNQRNWCEIIEAFGYLEVQGDHARITPGGKSFLDHWNPSVPAESLFEGDGS